MSKINLATTPRVTVFKRVVNETTGREFTDVLHRGFLVGQTTTHLKVWSPDKNSGDGPDPESASLYAISSPRIWCEVVQPSTKTNTAKNAPGATPPLHAQAGS